MNITNEYYLDHIIVYIECVNKQEHLFKLNVSVEFDCLNSDNTVQIAPNEIYSITACDYKNPNGPCSCIGYKPYGDKQVYVTEQMSDVENMFSLAREILKEPNKYYEFVSHHDIENYMMK